MKRLAKWVVGPAQINESYIAHAMLRPRQGLMLDVGAHFGSHLAPFADDGWSVHAFEPDPGNRAELSAAFGRYPNVTIVPKGVSDRPGEVPLFASEESTGISSFTPFTEGHEAIATVEVLTLRDYLAETRITRVDFLKIDVEGFERNVLNGYDWAVKPDVIVLEFEDSKTVPLGYSWTDLAGELVSRGYQVLVSEWFPVEHYAGDHKWRRFAPYPTKLEHPDAWGNLIAAASLEEITAAARRALARMRLRRGLGRLVPSSVSERRRKPAA